MPKPSTGLRALHFPIKTEKHNTMNYIIHPEEIIRRACDSYFPVKGSAALLDQCSKKELERAATVVAMQLADFHPEGAGFGSSDFTFLLKDFFQELIYWKGLHQELKTDFPNGRLEVVAL